MNKLYEGGCFDTHGSINFTLLVSIGFVSNVNAINNSFDNRAALLEPLCVFVFT